MLPQFKPLELTKKVNPVYEGLFFIDFKSKERIQYDLENIKEQFISYDIKDNIITFTFNDNEDFDLNELFEILKNTNLFTVSQHDTSGKIYRKILINITDDIFFIEYKQSYESNELCKVKIKMCVIDINMKNNK